MMRPRILMADDHCIVLAGLRELVEAEGHVVGNVEDGRAHAAAAGSVAAHCRWEGHECHRHFLEYFHQDRRIP
jgi:CheY-like chemotaxis protein